eukprot:TRINITY_DN83593_c0_g1_i1.p1 TRINITY_DN83593_c0_g1~~TRINITY_DN83593_c0_g1_i1.p1  ORF type:complete len:233 (+),score=36.87 TRINITY_DN83593_c0_g1_i1:517-1215(+)
MLDSAEYLLYTCHGMALRKLCLSLGSHCDGLSSAARLARVRGLVSPKLSRKLQRLDTAVALLRHVTQQSCDALVAEVDGLNVGNVKPFHERKVTVKETPEVLEFCGDTYDKFIGSWTPLSEPLPQTLPLSAWNAIHHKFCRRSAYAGIQEVYDQQVEPAVDKFVSEFRNSGMIAPIEPVEVQMLYTLRNGYQHHFPILLQAGLPPDFMSFVDAFLARAAFLAAVAATKRGNG